MPEVAYGAKDRDFSGDFA